MPIFFFKTEVKLLIWSHGGLRIRKCYYITKRSQKSWINGEKDRLTLAKWYSATHRVYLDITQDFWEMDQQTKPDGEVQFWNGDSPYWRARTMSLVKRFWDFCTEDMAKWRDKCEKGDTPTWNVSMILFSKWSWCFWLKNVWKGSLTSKWRLTDLELVIFHCRQTGVQVSKIGPSKMWDGVHLDDSLNPSVSTTNCKTPEI